MTTTTEKPKRGGKILLIVLLVLVVLVIGAEFLLRALLPGFAADKARSALGLPHDQQIDIATEGLLLPQVLGGSLSTVTLASEDVTLGGLTGDVDIVATGVPVAGGAFEGISGTMRIDPDDVIPLLASSPLPVQRVLTDAPYAVFMGEADVFGAAVALTLSVLPSVADGDLLIEPVAASVGGFDLDIEDAANMLGETGEELLHPEPLCIADRMPKGLSLTDLVVEDESIVVSFTADGALATDAALRAPGTCG